MSATDRTHEAKTHDAKTPETRAHEIEARAALYARIAERLPVLLAQKGDARWCVVPSAVTPARYVLLGFHPGDDARW